VSGAGSRLAIWWVELVTRGLPDEVADRRREELRSDLWEQQDDARCRGRSPAATQRDIAMRTATGVAADLSWSRHIRRARPVGGAMAPSTRPSSASFVSPAVAVGVVVAALVAVAAVGVGGPVVAAVVLVLAAGGVLLFTRSARARRPAQGQVPRSSTTWGTIAFGAIGALMLTFLGVALFVEEELSEPAWAALAGLVLVELTAAMVALVLWLANRPGRMPA
jgi:hypothetical protein